MIEKIIEIILAPLSWLWRRHERAVLCPGGDRIVMVVVTPLTPKGSVLRCHYMGDWYGLVYPDDWSELHIEDVPVSRDQKLARAVIFDGLPEE
jgi:hypothetical protein